MGPGNFFWEWREWGFRVAVFNWWWCSVVWGLLKLGGWTHISRPEE